MASMLGAAGLKQGPLAKLTSTPKTGYDLSRVGGGLTRGPQEGKVYNAAAWSQTWPAPGATLDLDFANDRGFVRGVGQGRSMDAVTFTRASSANWVDSTGVMRTGAGTFTGTANALGNNLFTFPQDFDNSAWTKLGGSVTANTAVAPDGTLTADKYISDTTNTFHGVRQAVTVTSGATYIFSAYVKAAEYSFIYMNIADSLNRFTWFDLNNGTVGTNASGTTASISSVEDGWYRVSISRAPDSTTASCTVAAVTGNNVQQYTGTGTSGILIWGAQLESGSSATTYYPTNINVPRFDWASTEYVQNLLLYTEQFNNAYWTKGSVNISSDTLETQDPLGGNTADKYTATAVSSGLVRNSVVPSGTYSFSCYFKSANQTNVALLITASGNGRIANFNLSSLTATISNQGTGGSVSGGIASIEDVGSGWYRCKIERIVSAGTNNIIIGGNGTNGETFYLWGAQLEFGFYTKKYISCGAYSISSIPLIANTKCNGLLLEEARTNLLLWCRDATNNAWVKTNVTAAKNQTGIDGVANAASSLTASADNGTCVQILTLSSALVAGSIYIKRITGSGVVQVSIDDSTWTTVDLSNGLWNRVVISGTVTNPRISIRLTTNGDAVAVDYGQIERTSFATYATSPILTTTASVTRSQDIATMSDSNFINWYKPDAGTIISEFFVNGTNAGDRIILDINEAGGTTGNTRTGISCSAPAYFSGVILSDSIGASNLAANISSPITANFMQKCSLAYAQGNYAAAQNGNIFLSKTNSSSMRINKTIMYIGSSGTSYLGGLNGCIKSITFLPVRLNDGALQNISTL